MLSDGTPLTIAKVRANAVVDEHAKATAMQDKPPGCDFELIRVEAEGAVLTHAPDLIPGAYNIYALLATVPGAGPGAVRVYSIDDRLLGTFPFERRARSVVAISEEDSWATLTAQEDAAAPGTLFELRVAATNPFGEPLGISCDRDIAISGGAQEGPMMLEDAGTLRTLVRSDGSGPVLTVAVQLSGFDLPESQPRPASPNSHSTS